MIEHIFFCDNGIGAADDEGGNFLVDPFVGKRCRAGIRDTRYLHKKLIELKQTYHCAAAFCYFADTARDMKKPAPGSVREMVTNIASVDPTSPEHVFSSSIVVKIAAHNTVTTNDDLAFRSSWSATIHIPDFNLLIRQAGPDRSPRPPSIHSACSLADKSAGIKQEKLVVSESP